MSDNPNYELYYENDNGEKILFNPQTIANAVQDESNNNTVQGFIDKPYLNDEENAEEKQYVSAFSFKEWKDDFVNEFTDGFDRILHYNNLIYCGEVDITPTEEEPEIPNFRGIELPVKKGSLYKIVCDNSVFYKDRVYNNGDYIFFNRYIDKQEHDWYESDDINDIIEILKGYGNGDLGINSVVIKAFATKADMEEYTDLDDYVDKTKEFIVIVANDENHRNLISFYQYCENIEDLIPEDEIQIVSSEEEMYRIKVFKLTPDFNYTLNEEDYIIVLDEYIDDDVNVTVPTYEEVSDFKKYVKIEKEDHNVYYKWNGYEWVYIGDSNSHWMYLFSHEDDVKIKERMNELEYRLNTLMEYIDSMNERVRMIENRNDVNIGVVDTPSEGNRNNTLYIIRR